MCDAENVFFYINLYKNFDNNKNIVYFYALLKYFPVIFIHRNRLVVDHLVCLYVTFICLVSCMYAIRCQFLEILSKMFYLLKGCRYTNNCK